MKKKEKKYNELTFKQLMKKYGAEGVLELYLHDKIKLTDEEWNEAHDNINGGLAINTKLSNKYSEFICLAIIVVSAIISVGGQMDKLTECKKMTGHVCSNYEVEKVLYEKN